GDVGDDDEDADGRDRERRHLHVAVADVRELVREHALELTAHMRFSRPLVTATPARFGDRPNAKAFGAGSSTMYTFGFGSPVAMHSPSITLWSTLACSGDTSTARVNEI